jgi:hypothetical protein
MPAFSYSLFTCHTLLPALIKQRDGFRNKEVVIAAAAAGTVITEVELLQLHAN